MEPVNTAVLAGCGGFLLAVLWMDLIFDVQVLAHRGAGAQLPEPVLSSIAAYYHRATTTARPMNRLIAAVMLVLLAALGFRAARGADPPWWTVSCLLLAGVPIGLAAVHTVPSAVRLGTRGDDLAGQSKLARGICRDHLVCGAGLAAFLVLVLIRAGVA